MSTESAAQPTSQLAGLKIGMLGASRIGRKAILSVAAECGARVVAVAATDPARAQEYAQTYGIEQVVSDYAAVIEHPLVEVVYNPLPNGMHGYWNRRALAAGKHVLSEKPFAANQVEAGQVRDAAAAAGLHAVEAFHYRYHPLNQAMIELAASGELGEITDVHATMVMPPPRPGDLRWSEALAGGGLMDVGCYSIHALRDLAGAFGGEPRVVSATAAQAPVHGPGVDAELTAELVFPNGVRGHLRSSMVAPEREFSWRLVGSGGSAFAPSFVQAHEDPRILLSTPAGESVRTFTDRMTYAFQLDALRATIRTGAPFLTDADDAVLTMGLIDDCYRAAGWEPRRPVRD